MKQHLKTDPPLFSVSRPRVVGRAEAVAVPCVLGAQDTDCVPAKLQKLSARNLIA